MAEWHDEILTVREAAAYLKLAESSVYRMAQTGQLPGRKIGGTWRFSRRGLSEWISTPDWMKSPVAEE